VHVGLCPQRKWRLCREGTELSGKQAKFHVPKNSKRMLPSPPKYRDDLKIESSPAYHCAYLAHAAFLDQSLGAPISLSILSLLLPVARKLLLVLPFCYLLIAN